MTLLKPKSKPVQLNTAIDENLNREMRDLVARKNLRLKDVIELGIKLAIEAIEAAPTKEES